MDTQPAELDSTAPRTPAARAALPHSLDALREALDAPPHQRAHHLGQALVERGLIDAATLAQALQAQQHLQPHRLLGQLLVDAGQLSAVQLLATLAAWMGVPMVDLAHLAIEPETLRRVPRALAEREGVLPLMLHHGALVVAVPDPWDPTLLDQLRFACQSRVLPVLALPGTLAPAVAQAYAVLARTAPPATGDGDNANDIGSLLRALGSDSDAVEPADGAAITESDNTLVRLVNALIADAVRLRASDIH
ncbi:MAG: type II/IV secretion system protein, partial [Burkholderiales bacterium]|nr:type II/IV secretion system protein [Burkholderiales bacterium]